MTLDVTTTEPVPVQRARTADEQFRQAVRCLRADDIVGAATLAEQASRGEPDRVVYAETARYLSRLAAGKRADVYATPEAFTAFASGGGNVGLYRATHRALGELYAAHRPRRLLDLGTGEGHGLLPALDGHAEASGPVRHVDFVEPSVPRGDLVSAALTARGVAHHAFPMTAQAFTELPGVGPWDLTQETFAMQTLPRRDRRQLFRWLRSRTTRLVVAEFDVPEPGPGWFRYVVDRYERGIREYDTDRDLVAQGFLVPVLLGVLGDSGHQQHHEHPITQWSDDLVEAGFDVAPPQPLYDYWWGPAYLITATAPDRTGTGD